jgi:hypothetical protein
MTYSGQRSRNFTTRRVDLDLDVNIFGIRNLIGNAWVQNGMHNTACNTQRLVWFVLCLLF